MTNLSSTSPPLNQWRAEEAFVARLIEGHQPFNDHGVRCEHLGDLVCRLVFERVQRRAAAGLPISPGDIAVELQDEPAFEKAGSVVFLIEAGRRAETAPASETLATVIIDSWQRRGALSIYESLANVYEEACTNLTGVTSRYSGRDQVATLLGWLAENYAAAKRLIEPAPAQFTDEVDGVGRLLFLTADELLELALIHETHANSCEQVGNVSFADLRRQRAEQLRAMLAGAQA